MWKMLTYIRMFYIWLTIKVEAQSAWWQITCPWILIHLCTRILSRFCPLQKLSKLFNSLNLNSFIYNIYIYIFCLFRAAHAASGSSRVGVGLELQLPAYATDTATQDPSYICDLHHTSQQCWIHNPLSKARDQTHILMDTGWIPNPLHHNGNS